MAKKIDKSLVLLGAAGAAALIASGTSSKKSSKKKFKHGVRVSKDCSQVRIEDDDQFNEFIDLATLEVLSENPEMSFYGVADVLLKDIMPDCKTYPETPQSADVYSFTVELYSRVGRQILANEPSKVLDTFTEGSASDFGSWISENGDKFSNAIPHPDTSERVSFSPDLTNYTIGKDFKKSLVRLIEAMKDNGFDFNQAEEYILDREIIVVQVGNEFEYLAALDSNAEGIKRFRAYLEKEIEKLY